jgi:hypothetical protein
VSAVQLYPVPVKSQLTITHNLSGIKYVKLYGTWGQLIYAQTVNNQNAVQLDMRKFPAGNYVVEVTDENGEITREQIVKE